MSICIECNCTSSTFDEVLGETVCDDCGLVQVVRPFEETVSYISSKDKYIPTRDNDSTKGLGSYIIETNTRNGFALKRQHIRARPVTEAEKRTILHTRMYLSYYNVTRTIRDQVPRLYRSLVSDRVTRGIPVEKIAGGLSYFMLKDAGYGVTLRKHSELTKIEFSAIAKYAKRIARHFNKSYVFADQNPVRTLMDTLERMDGVTPEYRQSAILVAERIYKVLSDSTIRYTPNMQNSTLWLVARMMDEPHSQKKIIEAALNGSEMGIRTSVPEMLSYIGLNKERMLSMSVEEFLSGAYKYE